MATMRQRIIDLLMEDECDAREVSQAIGIKEKEVYEHLPHIAKTLSKQGKKLKTEPARCVACGYAFKNRERATKPSRCPVCKSERIENPRFRVK